VSRAARVRAVAQRFTLDAGGMAPEARAPPAKVALMSDYGSVTPTDMTQAQTPGSPSSTGLSESDRLMNAWLLRFPKWAFGSAVAVFPGLVVLAHAYLLAGGDTQTTVNIVAGLNPITLLLSFGLSFIESGLPAIFALFYYCVLYIQFGLVEVEAHFSKRYVNMLTIAFLLLGILTTNSFILMAVVVALAIGLIYLRWRLSSRPSLFSEDTRIKRRRVRRRKRLSVIIAYYHISWFLMVPIVPYPSAELMQTASNSRPQWVYVIDVGNTHTKVLHRNGGVEEIGNSDIVERATCPDSFMERDTPLWVWHPSLLRLLFQRKSEYISPLCWAAPPLR
jgi:hypothetical protein